MLLTHTCCDSLAMVQAPANKNQNKTKFFGGSFFLSCKWFEWEVIANVSYLGYGGSDWQLSDREAGGLGQGLSVFAPHHAHRGLKNRVSVCVTASSN